MPLPFNSRYANKSKSSHQLPPLSLHTPLPIVIDNRTLRRNLNPQSQHSPLRRLLRLVRLKPEPQHTTRVDIAVCKGEPFGRLDYFVRADDGLFVFVLRPGDFEAAREEDVVACCEGDGVEVVFAAEGFEDVGCFAGVVGVGMGMGMMVRSGIVALNPFSGC